MNADGRSADIRIRDVQKAYGETRAIDDINLNVEAGEFISLLGPSGSGKTTLLGVLGGFVIPTKGRIYVGDRDMTYTPPHKRNIGVVFQSYALFPHMSVGENVAFPLKARRIGRSERDRRVTEALKIVDLADYASRAVSQLSGGQRQRVALARAIVFEPPVILMDEPLSALDKQLREVMQFELRKLHEKIGATIIYVTHDQREALTMSDRIAVLRDGKIIQLGSPQDLHDDPIDDFVAEFVGDSTLVPVSREDENHVRCGDDVLRTRSALPGNGVTLRLVIQSAKAMLDTGDLPDELNRLRGAVTEVVYEGSSSQIVIALDNGARISLRHPTNALARSHTPAIDDAVMIALHPSDTIVVPMSRLSDISSNPSLGMPSE